jgi:hypothetical protein
MLNIWQQVKIISETGIFRVEILMLLYDAVFIIQNLLKKYILF